MSDSRWCYYGQHVFSADDKDAVQDTVKMQIRQSDGSYQLCTLQRDICGAHMSEAVNLQRPQLTNGDDDAVSPR